MGWNNKEISHRILTSIMCKSSTEKTKREVEVRLNADVHAFLAGGRTIEYIPTGQHTIDAATNKAFCRPYSQRVVK